MAWNLTGETSKQFLFRCLILALIYVLAFSGRFYSVLRFESVIHEFDPWFNYRATRYLVEHDAYDFLNWFDETSWYPLGRIVGGTVYPGLMMTAGTIFRILHSFNITLHIREVCVFLAPWMASNTTLAAFLLAREVKDAGAGLLAAAFISIIPGYISRSVAGSYDNEGVAIFAMVFTFWLWIKAVRTGGIAWAAGAATGYFYMVAAWGGYVFMSNIMPLHVVALLVVGRYSSRLYVAYSTFYTLSTIMSMQVFFVGFRVLRTSDHLAMHGTFLLLQAWAFLGWLTAYVPNRRHRRRLLYCSLSVAAVVVTCGLLLLVWLDYIQPFTGRFWSMFDPTYASKYIPIIASVSEHQPTTYSSYLFDLHILIVLLPVGLYHLFCHLSDGSIFLILYSVFACYFSGVMVRLMLVLAPAVCVLGAVAVSSLLDSFVRSSSSPARPLGEAASLVGPVYQLPEVTKASNAQPTSAKKKGAAALPAPTSADAIVVGTDITPQAAAVVSDLAQLAPSASFDQKHWSRVRNERQLQAAAATSGGDAAKAKAKQPPAVPRPATPSWTPPLETRIVVVLSTLLLLIFYVFHCNYVTSAAYSSPSIVIEGGQGVLDDYREAYYWLRQNTDEDARVMSWWDYGYQIAGMANRTVLVDNNTWNNSHIAQVGKAMASSEEKALPILRQLDVDYVLVIFGGLIGYSGDDINKFLWMIRIAGSTDPNIKEKDYFTDRGEYKIDDSAPKAMMNSLMYKLSFYRFNEVDYHGGQPGFDRVRHSQVSTKQIRLKYLEEAYTTEHWMVRIYRVKDKFKRGPEGFMPLTPLAPPRPLSLTKRKEKYRANSRGKLSPPALFKATVTGGAELTAEERKIANRRALLLSLRSKTFDAADRAVQTRRLAAALRLANSKKPKKVSRWMKRIEVLKKMKGLKKAKPKKK